MRRIGTALMLVALAATVACTDQQATSLEPEVDVQFSHGLGGLATYEVTVENLTGGQPFTPPLAVTHKKPLTVFQVGEAASMGVQEIAENGNLAPLQAALTGHKFVSDLVIAVDPAVPPILQGTSRTFTITADRGAKYISFVSMLICTNDGFTGLSGVRLPKYGELSQHDLAGYDAGTEINTESFADMVPPCDPLTGGPGGSGTGTSDPALAENGVIHMHQGIQGGSDLDPALHGWTDPVATVWITRLN